MRPSLCYQSRTFPLRSLRYEREDMTAQSGEVSDVGEGAVWEGRPERVTGDAGA